MTYKEAQNEQELREILVLSLYRKTKNLEDAERLYGSYCQIWCLRLVGHAAIWSGFVASIPSLNVTPVITLAR